MSNETKPVGEQSIQEQYAEMGKLKAQSKKMSTKIKTHLKKHKEAYIVGGVSLTVGVGVGYFLHKHGYENDAIVNNIQNVVSPVFNNTNTNTNTVNFGGYSRKLVKCVDTGQIWESVKDASAAAGVQPAVMSRHLNGHSNDIKGKLYEIIGVGTNS